MLNSPSQYDEKLDRRSILDRLEGNEELMIELARLFLGEAPHMLEEMRKALQQGDMQGLCLSAHSMKGAAANFSAHATTTAASRLEVDAKNADPESARFSLAGLEKAVDRLLVELVELCEGSAK